MKGKVGGQWNKIFMEIFRSMSHGFCPFSSVSLTELYSFWYGLKDLFTLHKLADKVAKQQNNNRSDYEFYVKSSELTK